MNRANMQQLWQERVMPWWASRSEREQQLVRWGGVLVAVAVLVFGLILPLHDRVAALRAELPLLASQAAEARQLASMAQRVSAADAMKAEPLISRIERLSKQAGVREQLVRLRPDAQEGGQLLSLQFQNVSYAGYVRFLYVLVRQGADVSDVHIQAASDPGRVHVQMKVRGS